MKSTTEDFSFKALLSVLPRGEPLDVSFLKEKGLSAFHASHLAAAGWLTHVGRGVYMLPGDTLSRDGCLAYLMRRNAGLHVGGKTALAWRGVKHNIVPGNGFALGRTADAPSGMAGKPLSMHLSNHPSL
jgi:hypothetical protein